MTTDKEKSVMSATTMSHRDRVLAALNHEQPDRVPIDFGGGIASTIYYTAYDRLKEHLGVGDTSPAQPHLRKQSRTVIPDDAILERFDIDTRCLLLGGYEGGGHEINEDVFIDEWGTTWTKTGTHCYMDTNGPFYGRAADIADLDAHEWPDPDNPGLYRGLVERAQARRADGDHAIVLNLPVGIIHQCQFVRGYGEWLMDLHRHPNYAGHMMDIIADYWIRVSTNALELVGNDVDVVFFGDDMGTQRSTLFSPYIYRTLIKPRHKRMFDVLKSWPDLKVALHSCGATSSLFEDMIELGVDAVNPVQVNAANMEPERLKAEFGDRLSFWGAIDTQKVLPLGSADDVRQEVRRMIDILGQGGGYVLNSVHNIQPDVPPENVVAMFDEARNYRGVYE
jgi:uroporphyrinogen decarboxylase